MCPHVEYVVTDQLSMPERIVNLLSKLSEGALRDFIMVGGLVFIAILAYLTQGEIASHREEAARQFARIAASIAAGEKNDAAVLLDLDRLNQRCFQIFRDAFFTRDAYPRGGQGGPQ